MKRGLNLKRSGVLLSALPVRKICLVEVLGWQEVSYIDPPRIFSPGGFSKNIL